MLTWDAQRAQLRPAQPYERKVTCTDVYVFCGPGSKSPMMLKKPRRDKRESHSSRGLLDDNPRKLRERPSWLSISRQPSSSLGQSGSWKQVTCHLHDNAGEANLQLFTEDQHLQHSVHVNSLFGPNVRIVDPTLLSRRHVLAIHGHSPMSASASTSTSAPTPCEPIYLEFRTRETLNSWLVLLRSFARPDVRSHPYSSFSFSPSGSYRMWRHLQVQVIAARRFSTKVPPERISSDESNPKDHDRELDKDVWEVYFEVVLNGASVGRTALKYVPASAWQAERIVVMDPDVGGGTWAGAGGADADFGLAGPEWSWGIDPPVASAFLEVRVWRSKSSSLFGFPSTTHVASVPIDLGPFRRGEPVKAWWPGFNQISGQQDGELMMEIKFDEEIVLPLEDYRKMKEVLARRNYFELWQGLTARVPIPISTATHLISLALHQGILASHLCQLASTEINCPDTKPSTLFRGNSLLTRVAEPTMAILGARGFLEASLGHVVRKMYHEKVVFDFGAGGPAAGSATAAGVVEGADLMAQWLREMWNSIWRARNECPEELRQLFYHIRSSVDNRWGSSSVHTDLKYQAISAFLFLRFFVPAMLRPDQHSLVVGPPPEGVEKSLKSLARALQSLANLNTGVQREEFMRSVKTFNEENVDAMIDYLIFVSTPGSSPHSHSHPTASQSRASAPEHQIRAALQARLPALSTLHRESLPMLPYMTDEARDLAVIASAVVRNARTAEHPGRTTWQEVGPMNERLEDLGNQAGTGDPGDEQKVDEAGPGQSELQQDVVQFVKACFDVQTEAMRRVVPPTAGTGVGKKPARRRKRRTEDSSTRVEERLSVGTNTTSVEGGSTDGREHGQVPTSMPGPSTSAGMEYLAVRSEVMRSLPTEPSVKPDIVRQPSNLTVSSETKKSKGVFKFMGLRR